MTQYQYHGRNSNGQEVHGNLDSTSRDAAATQLMNRGITPVRIEQGSSTSSRLPIVLALMGTNKVRTVDLVMFCRQMYTITKAGIPLTRGIRGLAASIRHDYLREVLEDVTDRLESGMSLSVAMRHHPKVFNSLFVNMISVGESSGKLDEVFRQIGFYIERDQTTRKRIKSAMRYPTFVLIALVVALTILNIYVIPAFATFFNNYNVELPLLTRVLIAVSYIFTHYGFFLFLFFVIVISAWVYFINTPQGAVFWGQKKMRIPIVGGLIERASMARYARSFSLMLMAGVPITQALNLCASAMDNAYLFKKIQEIKSHIERGESLFRTHQNAELFTPLVLQMIAVGEESGQVENLLTDVAEFYEREVEYDLKTLTDRIEPLLIVVMAGFVLVLALGIFLPMWSMLEVQRS